MTEKKHEQWRWVHILREKWLLPALTAYVANYLVRGQLKPLAERLPEPWADVIAHPIVECILDWLVWLAFFLGVLFLKKLVKYYVLTLLILIGILHFALVRYAHASKVGLYVLWCSVVWGAVALLLWLLSRAMKAHATVVEEDQHPLVPRVLVPDEHGVPRAISEDVPDLFGKEFSRIISLTLLSALMSGIATVLLGIMLWDGIRLSATKSIIVSLVTGSILAIGHRRIAMDYSEP